MRRAMPHTRGYTVCRARAARSPEGIPLLFTTNMVFVRRHVASTHPRRASRGAASSWSAEPW